MTLEFNYHTNTNESHRLFSNDYQKDCLLKFKEIIDNPQNGFFHLTNDFDYLNKVKVLAAKHKDKKHFIQIGIGGSALGPQMLVSALQKDFTKSFTVLDNIDSDYISQELAKIDLTQSIFYIVSKSGGTAETLACYAIIKNELSSLGIGADKLCDHLVFCTENKNSELMQHIQDNEYDYLEVPLNIGGRFSVLSHVGLLPAFFCGVNIDELYQGANELKDNLLCDDFSKNDLIKSVSNILFLQSEHAPHIDQTVLMPYSSILRDLSFWFVQLWAESLGKWSNKEKKSVGLTPIPAYGATDQHSQVQLFMEGPNNKLIFMLKVNNTKNSYSMNSDINIERSKLLNKFKLHDLMLAEFTGTKKALIENHRNVIELSIQKVDEKALGMLVLFFESLTALVGHEMQINPFNQPGVEKGKIYAFEYLKNK